MVRFVCPVLAVAFLSAEAPTGEKETAQARYVRLVNQLRVAAKAQPLKVDAKLMAAAQKNAENMARLDRSSDPANAATLDGKTLNDRLTAESYVAAAARDLIQTTAAAVDPLGVAVKSLAAVPQQRKVMLAKEFTETGTGAARSKSGQWYFVQILARPLGGPATATDFAYRVTNATALPITLRVKAAKFVQKIPAGNTGTFQLMLQAGAGEAPVAIAAEVATERGKPTSFQVSRDGHYTVTGDAKKLKVEKTP